MNSTDSLIQVIQAGRSSEDLKSESVRAQLKRDVVRATAAELERRVDPAELADVTQELKQRLLRGGDGNSSAEWLVDAVIKSWAGAANRHLVSVALQLAAEDRFKLSGCAPPDLAYHGTREHGLAVELVDDYGSVFAALIDVFHAQTQSLLPDGELVIFRGVRDQEWPTVVSGPVPQRGLSSWTACRSVAEGFAREPHGSRQGAQLLLTHRTTKERIASTPLTTIFHRAG